MSTDIETGPQPEKQQPSGTLFSGARTAKPPARVILHVDMDCFFASVATLGHPSFPGKPLCVAHSNSATVRWQCNSVKRGAYCSMNFCSPMRSCIAMVGHLWFAGLR